MKRAMMVMAVATFCIAGSAVAQDRSGLIGSGTRTESSGVFMGSGGFVDSGTSTAAADQMMGSGGFLGSGNLEETQDGGGTIGSGTRQMVGSGGYFGSGLAVLEIGLLDGSSVLVVVPVF